MPVIENLKNFIRHGKQANNVSVATDHSHHHHQSQDQPDHQQESHHHRQYHPYAEPRMPAVAKAEIQSYPAAETTPVSQQASRREYDEAIARLVAEEKEQNGKLPRYPGLEKWKLLEKMGDGAFSNVYKAQHRENGQKVAIKVVRKYELSSSQVRFPDFLFLNIYK